MKALKLILIFCLIFIPVNMGMTANLPLIPVTGFSTSLYPVYSSADSPFNMTLEDFISRIKDGGKEIIRGVYAADAFALRVVQQPSNQPGFVSTLDGVTTQFMDAKRYGSIGLLSHNYLSGKLFYQLEPGDFVYLIYGDGMVKKFQVESIHQYQALQPENPHSTFVDLATGAKISSTDLFLKIYASQNRLILQTCLQNGDELSWGRHFIISKPAA